MSVSIQQSDSSQQISHSDSSGTGAESGTGGNDLSSYSSDQTIIDNLLVGTFTNNSSYTFPNAVNLIAFNNEDSIPQQDPAGTGSESGTGGDTLQSWLSKDGIINNLLVGTFTNESSFSIPSQVTIPTAEQSTQIDNGYVVSVYPLDVDNVPLPGSFSLTRGGVTEAEGSNSGGIITVSSPPPGGVPEGSDVDEVGSTFTYTPNTDGLPLVEDSITSSIDLGTVQYGEVSGEITDVDGNGVPQAAIVANGESFVADNTGGYSVKAPGGTSVTFNAVGDSVVRTPSGGSTITVNFQYGGVTAELTLPDGTGIPGIEVSANKSRGSIVTDSAGQVRFTQVEVGGDLIVNIGQKFEEQRQGPSQGQEITVSRQTGIGFKGSCVDTDANPVVDADCRIDVDDPIVSFVDENGNFAIGDDDSGGVGVVFCEDDRRYYRTEEYRDLSDGEVAENVRIVVEEQLQMGQFG